MKELIKKIYDLTPFKKHIFVLVKKVYKPKESLYRHLHFKGVIDIKVNQNAAFKMNHFGYQIENEVFWEGLEGGWEKVSVGLWVKLAQNATTIFDIGANTGIFAMIAKSVTPSARVYAFEPLKRVHQKLASNIELNRYDIKSYPLAISNANGKAFVYDQPTSENVYSVTVNGAINPQDIIGSVKTEIDIVTLDTFIDENKVQGIDLMKIDVETHEGEVLEGFRGHLAAFKPTFLIEILRNEVGEKVQHCLEGLGYLYFNINEGGEPTQVDKIMRRGHNYNYLLCQPHIANQLGLIK